MVRRMQEKDLEQVAALEQTYFSIPWSQESLAKEVENDRSLFCVVEYEDKVVGYGGMLLVPPEGDVTNIVVHEDYRRQGFGEMILNYLIEEGIKKGMTEFTLEVRVSNHGAVSLYEKLGFVSEGVRPKMYERPVEDGYIMWKRI